MKSFFHALIGIILLLAVWQLLALILNKSIVPAPAETLSLLAEMLIFPPILLAAWQTAWKVFLALLLVMLIGLPLGLCLGLSKTVYSMFRPIIMVIQAVPVISWLSLVIFAWGIGWKGPVFIAFLSLLPLSILTTVAGVRNLDNNLLEMARIYRVPGRRVIKDIYLGSLLPFIAAIVDVSIGQAWKVILVAEYLSGGSGLGVEILRMRMNIDFPGVWALTLLAVFLGIITERLIKKLLGRLSHQWTIA
ncbi:MAG: ABC transporter permease subunit [Syntrophomonadaceae bacterium]|jgi:NitT/TauT family transport system permease protein|nr:ABC transporter permease subunit [Syntrophomonadaceae bacterium]